MSRSTVGMFLRPQRGLTLVELMVALVMGLVLLGGVVTVFVANKEAYRFQDALARVQENGRFTLSRLTRELRSSGHFGCNSLKPQAAPKNTLGSTAFISDPTTRFADYLRPVDAFQSWTATTWNPALDDRFLNLPAERRPSGGSDVILIRVVDGSEVRATNHPSPNANIDVRGATTFQSGDILLVSDCDAAAVFQLAAIPTVSGSTSTLPTGGFDLGKQFPSAASAAGVQKIHNVAYYVATSGVTGEPALWRWDGINAAEEVAAGVELLRVRFGVDTNGDQAVDQYEPANLIETGNNWGKVISVRVSLVVRSPDENVTSGGQAYVLDGASVPVATSDTRLRQVFTTTVAVRNKQS